MVRGMIDEIIQGDCLDVMKGLADDSVDLVVTSPPYDNLRTYKGYTFNFEGIARQLYRVTKQGGVVVWVVGDQTINGSETGTSFKQALYFKEIGFNLHDTMIYEKVCPKNASSNRYHSAFEFMFVLSKGIPKTANLLRDRQNVCAGHKIARKQSTYSVDGRKIENSAYKFDKNRIYSDYGIRWNIWRWGAGHITPTDIYKTQHPATFPDQLARDHILSWSNEGDLVLDPMCGSGTTCKMAMLNNRHYIGIDIAEEYCNIARQRVADAKMVKDSQPELFE